MITKNPYPLREYLQCQVGSFHANLYAHVKDIRRTIDGPEGPNLPRRELDSAKEAWTREPQDQRGKLVENPGLYARKVLNYWLTSPLFKDAKFFRVPGQAREEITRAQLAYWNR